VSLRHHEIAETGHRILNPLLEDQLRTIGEAAGVGPDTRVLDLCCGKGEMICRWAEWFGASSVGVDLSEIFVAAARARARELGVADRVEIVAGEAAAYAREAAAREPRTFDIVSCLGATWIGNGLAGTIELMRPLVRPGGAIVVGEPFLEEPMPAEGFAALDFGPDDYVSLAATVDRFDAAGVEVEEMIAADARGWERYEAAQWLAVARWLDSNPDDPDHAAMGTFLEAGRRNYVTWGRRYLGWAVFVTRPRRGATRQSEAAAAPSSVQNPG
jgi:SAM-dependent methyltransferase